MSAPATQSSSAALAAVNVRFIGKRVYVALSDGREVGLPLYHPDLKWLGNASPEQRAQWRIGPRGQTVLWDGLDDGIEIAHLLRSGSMSPY